jgi:hypothetical protein
MYEERTGKCLRQVEHIRGHLGHRYSITVNQVMVTTVKLSKWWFQLNQEERLVHLASLLAATLYQWNPDRNHKLWNIVSTEMLLHINGKFTMENWNHLFCRKVSFLIAPHCQFRGVGQGIKQTAICICGILYFKLIGIDAINEITKPKII